jgi:methionine-gamma-lyase
MKNKKYRFATVTVHGGEEGRFLHNPSSTPIYQTSTFFFNDTKEAGDVAGNNKEGFLYTRVSNPTVKAFEDKMALLEGGESAVAFSSGMAAISSVFIEFLRPGDEVISSRQIYAGSRGFFENTLKKLACPVRYFESGDDLKKTIPSLINRKTRVIFFETPTNPELSIIDISAIARLARQYKLISIMDNTFATPYLQKPLSYGIDCIIHSATKYICGHGDALGGIVVSSREIISSIRKNTLLNLGGCLSPFNAWLFLRGLKTLHIRMDHHCGSALKIANFLDRHKKVKDVLYPGLKTHAGHKTAKKQMKAFGGVVSFRLTNRLACKKFLNNLDLCKIGVSLGDSATLVLHSASLFHSKLSDSACRRIGIDPELIRISAGLEDVDDIIEDIQAALGK